MRYRLLPHHPAAYHGRESSRPYFEGWYFKQVSDTDAFAVIPGVYQGKAPEDDIAFIQVIFGLPSKSHFICYPLDAFRHSPKEFKVWIGDSYFSIDGTILNVPEIGLKAKLVFDRTIGLTPGFLSHTIMGPFAYLPAMQCSHGVISLAHEVTGEVVFGGRQIVFHNADGYIEKDWGGAFPQSWIWMQCGNHENAMMCAVASIPYGMIRFTGLICVLLIEGRQYRFATYNGAKVLSVEKHKNTITTVVGRGGYRLEISAYNDAYGSLKAPTRTGMDRDIQESINAQYDISFFFKNKKLFFGHFEKGGLELLNPEDLVKSRK